MLKYAVSPIVFLLPIISITAFAGDIAFFDMRPEFIVGMAAVYLLLSVFYLMLCRRGREYPAIAIACITDGMMWVFFSVAFESGIIFNFVGFMMIIVGIAVGIFAATPLEESLFARKIDQIMPPSVGMNELQKIINAIPFPCVFMERADSGGERIVAYNPQFTEDFKLGKNSILGKTLDSLLTMNEETGRVIHFGEEWTIKRTVRGKQILVMFSPILRSREASRIEVFDAIDVATGLYTAGFMKYKAKSDIELVNRGRRKLSAVLLKLTFPSGSGYNINDDERKLAAVIFGRVVEKSIRVCDSAYRTSDDEVLLIMPDTPNSGSKIVIARILTGVKNAAMVECPQCSKAIIDYIDKDYVGGIDLPSYDKILEELSAALYKKHPSIAAKT